MKTILGMLLVLGFAHASYAQDAGAEGNTTSVKQSDVTPQNTVQSQHDIDDEITNAKMRADTGAKSKFSFQSTFNYNGGSVEKPFDADRPRLDPGVTTPTKTKIQGLVSGKYRMTDHDNLNVGSGISLTTPGHGGQASEVANPYVSYGRVFKAGGLQNSFQAILTKYTGDQEVNDYRQNFNVDIAHTVIYSVGSTGVDVGATIDLEQDYYLEGVDGSERYASLFPFFEYAFNDKYSFRTVYWGAQYYTMRSAPETFINQPQAQSAGIGMALTRDIYLYPNIQWVWSDMRSDRTDVGLSMDVSL